MKLRHLLLVAALAIPLFAQGPVLVAFVASSDNAAFTGSATQPSFGTVIWVYAQKPATTTYYRLTAKLGDNTEQTAIVEADPARFPANANWALALTMFAPQNATISSFTAKQITIGADVVIGRGN